jgi:hypothetical protein
MLLRAGEGSSIPSQGSPGKEGETNRNTARPLLDKRPSLKLLPGVVRKQE